ncbi:MAG TPA: FG-GAP-like repeat-containing protein [Pseudomonadota bacterium]|nr:FG-GAP-like repeat-containing protein [Pseudomonadota bacterium]
MKRLHRGLGMGTLAICAVVLSQSHCTDAPSNGTNVGADGGVDMAMVVQPQNPPTTLAITSVNPPRLAQAATTVLSIGGTGFKQGATVTVGGLTCDSPSVSQVNYTGTLITCTAPAQPKICGKQTIVVTNPDGTSVTNNTLLLRYPAAVSFAARATIATGANPFGIAAADVDGDGNVDLIHSQFGAANFAVRLGNGDGTFKAGTTIGTGGNNPAGLAVADVNGDNKLDVIVANQGSNNVAFLSGNGGVAFAAPKLLTATAMNQPTDVSVLDVNKDGKLDILVSSYANGLVSVFLGDNAGNFTAQANVSAGASSLFLSTGDINGDGNVDFVSNDFSSGAINLRFGNGTGGFSPAQTIATGLQATAARFADVNQDGALDIVHLLYGTSKGLVFLGNGTGSYANPTQFTAANNPYNVVVNDLNRDGVPDLVVSNDGSSNMTVLLGDGKGGFASNATLATGANPYFLLTADLNKDGNMDIVSSDRGSSVLSVYLAVDQCK